MKNNAYELTEFPQGWKFIGCKWVFRFKWKANGEIDKYYARLLEKDFLKHLA